MGVVKTFKKSYYIPNTDPSATKDYLKRVFCRKVPDFPRVIQIQTQTGCNGACIFCPYEKSYHKVPKGKMSEHLFKKILEEIGSYNKTRRISPYLMNEPFLDQEIVQKSRSIKKMVKNCKVVITTNAGKLNQKVVDDIVSDNPFHGIYISCQGIEKKPYEMSMRGSLKFEETKKNVDYLIKQAKKYLPNLKIVVTMIKTNLIDVEKAVKYWQSLGVESKYTALENRGGNTAKFKEIRPCTSKIFKDCTRLFKQAFILFDGTMVLCCTDYYRTMILGNVAENPIYDVWNSPRAIEIRKNFIRGNLTDNPLCKNCLISGIN